VKFYTSDLHLNHVRIREFEPSRLILGDTLEKMNESIILRYNEVVRPDDDVYIIGDFAFGDKALIPGLVSRLMGRKHLIVGNHDFHKPGRIRPQLLAAGFESISEKLWITDGGKRLFLCHIPQLDGWQEADLHLCGHVHSSFDRAKYVAHDQRQTKETGFPGHFEPLAWGPVVNVGVDVSDFRPLTLEQLLARPHQVGKSHRLETSEYV
jgi:calcineurin-like phosphoesterase family protein